MIEYRTSVDFCLDALSGKWKTLILNQLSEQPQRLSDILDVVPGLCRRVLIRELRELEEDLVVKRTDYDESVPRVEYSLSEHGKALMPIIESMNEWGLRHLQRLENEDTRVLKADPVEDLSRQLAAGVDGFSELESLPELTTSDPAELKKKLVERSKRLQAD